MSVNVLQKAQLVAFIELAQRMFIQLNAYSFPVLI
jgi:hypothetical protein